MFEWLPNVHPLVIHFPIALLVLAVLVDVVGLFLRRFMEVQYAAVGLYVVGTIGTVAAYLTGQQAAEMVDVPAQAMSALASHEDWAFYTLIFFLVYSGARLTVTVLRPRPSIPIHAVLVLVGAVGLWPLMESGNRGGELVFTHGVGVQAVGELAAELEERRAQERAAEAAPVDEEDGGWSWHISEGSDEALVEYFDWLRGDAGEVEMEVTSLDGEDVLRLSMDDGEALFVYGEELGSVEIRARVNLDDFDGTVRLVHNVLDESEFNFLSYDGEVMEQGRRSGDGDDVFDEESHSESGRFTIRASGDAGHFYGYLNGETLTHGHGDTPDAGWTGLLLEGDGTVYLQRIEVEAIR